MHVGDVIGEKEHLFHLKTMQILCIYNSKIEDFHSLSTYVAVAQLVKRRRCDQKVVGSNPGGDRKIYEAVDYKFNVGGVRREE